MENTMITRLLNLARPSVIAEGKAADQLGHAVSKIGGNPDLPTGFVWPIYGDQPLSFMAQINLADVGELDAEQLLPRAGMLSFFYELDSQEWGYDASSEGCARVYYFPDPAALISTPLPDDLDGDFRVDEQVLTFTGRNSLPGMEEVERIFGQWPDWEIMEEARRQADAPGAEEAYGLDGPHRLLGYPDVIQGDLFAQCASLLGGEAGDWILLFQMGTLSTNGGCELMWGDCGKIYYCIRRSDLAQGNFDRIWLILQCG